MKLCGKGSELRPSTHPSRRQQNIFAREAMDPNCPKVQYILGTLVVSLAPLAAEGKPLAP